MRAFGPRVRRLSVSVMLPSRSPSINRSSFPESSPRTTTDLPMTVEPSFGFICFSAPKGWEIRWVLPELYASPGREANQCTLAIYVEIDVQTLGSSQRLTKGEYTQVPCN